MGGDVLTPDRPRATVRRLRVAIRARHGPPTETDLVKAFLPCLLLLATGAPAQNLLTNGDFELGSLTGWQQNNFGSASGPAVQQFNVNGFGATNAFGVQVGTTPVGIEQTVPLVAGRQYLFRADFAGDHPYSHSNGDGGQWEVAVGGAAIASGTLGGITGFETLRRHVCAPFVATATAPTAVEFRIVRGFLASGVRNYVDDVELIETTTPIVCVEGPRQIGTTMDIAVVGTAGAPYAVFLSDGALPTPGIVIPGIAGALRLAPPLIVQVGGGFLGRSGRGGFQLPLPNDVGLVGFPLYWQGLELGGAPSFGSLHFYPLRQ